jgi:hypothetical protein
MIRVIESWRMRWAEYVALMRDVISAYTNLGRISEGSRSLARTTFRSENNITMDNKEVNCEGADWISVAQDNV